MPGEGFKIRYRSRRGYTREAGGYTGWNEYQVVAGRKVVGRYDLLEQAQRDYPGAELDVTVRNETEIAKMMQRSQND